MRKLKPESLQVESFEITAAAPTSRGTVHAHAEAAPITGSACPTYDPCRPSHDPRTCQGTEDWLCCTLDCTLECTRLYETCGVDYCYVGDPTRNCTS
jgi:hypothetical protein